MRSSKPLALALALFVAATAILFMSRAAQGDTVELRDGTLIQGKYVGGTAGTIRIEAADGIKVLETANVLALTFASTDVKPATGPSGTSAQPAAAQAPAPAAAAAAAAAAPTSVQVPAGTVLTVKLDGPVSSKDPQGKKFSGKLLADLTANGKTVAKAGSGVYGQVDKSKQAGRLAGKSELAFSLSGVDIGGRTQPIVTTSFSEKGKGEFRKTARNAAVGGLVGHAVDDDGGAGAGAAIGAGVSLIKKGDAVTAPAGMILEFRLSQPFEATALP